MKRFRYPGVRPFEAADRALFFGRDRDITDLYELVRAEPLVVLFGKSGYGKSSLLNAGALPLFAETSDNNDDWSILKTRFGEYTEGASEMPLERLKRCLSEKHSVTHVWDFFQKNTFPPSLWLDFKQRLSPQNQRFLLVFDQFEEFFSYPPEQQAAFKDQLADLLYEEMPQAIRAAARSLERDERRALAARMEVKALFAIRSDRMSDLDRLKDRLPAILHKRYELRALTREQAREAIVQPALLVSSSLVSTSSLPPLQKERGDVERSVENAREIEVISTPPGGIGGGVETREGETFSSPPFEYRDDALQKILDELSRSNTVADKNGGIESFQLQILCDDIDSHVASGLVPDRNRNGLPDVSAEDLPDFSEVFARYYERRLVHLPVKQRIIIHKVIEDGLIRYDTMRDEGRRLSVDGQALLKDFEAAGLTSALLRELENTFLVRREPNTLGGYNYELSHDTLLAPVVSAKKKRVDTEEQERLYHEREQVKLEKEKAQRAKVRAYSVASGAIVLALFAGWQTWEATQAKSKAENLLISSRVMASKKLPKKFDVLIPLDSLNCNNWGIETLPSEVAKLKNLKSLDLSNNRLISLPNEIGNLPNLQSLELAGNLLTNLPYEIGNLSTLQSLNLYSNHITNLPKEVGNLQNLQLLDLGENQLSSLPKEIWNLKNLQLLDLGGNQLTYLSREVKNLNNLQGLILSVNGFSHLPEEIWRLKKLQLLDLGGNQLENLSKAVENLQNLRSLSLWENRLTNLPIEIRGLQNLQELDLRKNLLMSLPEEIANLQSLQSLYLRGNRLTSLPLEALKKLKNLKKLDLKNNPLLASEVETLRQVMPWCKVMWEE